tara:strand:+ start:384 stop:3557 length:3174 start_codon:yes stop_codon:yes gene_type:complete
MGLIPQINPKREEREKKPDFWERIQEYTLQSLISGIVGIGTKSVQLYAQDELIEQPKRDWEDTQRTKREAHGEKLQNKRSAIRLLEAAVSAKTNAAAQGIAIRKWEADRKEGIYSKRTTSRTDRETKAQELGRLAAAIKALSQGIPTSGKKQATAVAAETGTAGPTPVLDAANVEKVTISLKQIQNLNRRMGKVKKGMGDIISQSGSVSQVPKHLQEQLKKDGEQVLIWTTQVQQELDDLADIFIDYGLNNRIFDKEDVKVLDKLMRRLAVNTAEADKQGALQRKAQDDAEKGTPPELESSVASGRAKSLYSALGPEKAQRLAEQSFEAERLGEKKLHIEKMFKDVVRQESIGQAAVVGDGTVWNHVLFDKHSKVVTDNKGNRWVEIDNHPDIRKEISEGRLKIVRGMSGELVEEIQRSFAEFTVDGEAVFPEGEFVADGFYGAATEAGVKTIQAQFSGMLPNGSIDKATFDFMNDVINSEETGMLRHPGTEGSTIPMTETRGRGHRLWSGLQGDQVSLFNKYKSKIREFPEDPTQLAQWVKNLEEDPTVSKKEVNKIIKEVVTERASGYLSTAVRDTNDEPILLAMGPAAKVEMWGSAGHPWYATGVPDVEPVIVSGEAKKPAAEEKLVQAEKIKKRKPMVAFEKGGFRAGMSSMLDILEKKAQEAGTKPGGRLEAVLEANDKWMKNLFEKGGLDHSAWVHESWGVGDDLVELYRDSQRDLSRIYDAYNIDYPNVALHLKSVKERENTQLRNNTNYLKSLNESSSEAIALWKKLVASDNYNLSQINTMSLREMLKDMNIKSVGSGTKDAMLAQINKHKDRLDIKNLDKRSIEELAENVHNLTSDYFTEMAKLRNKTGDNFLQPGSQYTEAQATKAADMARTYVVGGLVHQLNKRIDREFASIDASGDADAQYGILAGKLGIKIKGNWQTSDPLKKAIRDKLNRRWHDGLTNVGKNARMTRAHTEAAIGKVLAHPSAADTGRLFVREAHLPTNYKKQRVKKGGDLIIPDSVYRLRRRSFERFLKISDSTARQLFLDLTNTYDVGQMNQLLQQPASSF